MRHLAAWMCVGIVAGCVAAGAETESSGIAGVSGETLPATDVTARSEESGRSSPPCIPGKVWNDASARIELSSFGFWSGASRYEKDRSELTPEQRDALAGLCVIRSHSGHAADIASYQITITDQNGVRRQYRAAYRDLTDIDEPQPGAKETISYDSLKSFLATLHCLSAGETRRIGPHDAGTAPWRHAPSLSLDPGCYNGIFVPRTCSDVWLKLPVDAKGTREIFAVDCIGTVTLRIFSGSGKKELARSEARAAPNCPKVAYRFERSGTYLLKVEKTNGSTCGDEGRAGDFFIRIRERQ